MIKAIKGTWKTLKNTFTVVARYRSSSLYPLLSYLILLLLTFTVLIPSFEKVIEMNDNGGLAWVLLVIVYLAYVALYFVIAFAHVMLVTGITGRLDGNRSGLTGILARAFQRFWLILLYTLVASTLGFVSFLLRTLINPLVGGIIAPLVGDKLWVRWHHLSYKIPLQMAVPVIALEQPAPKNMFKRSELLVKETWGERVKPAHGISLLAVLVLLAVILFAVPTLQQGIGERNPNLIRLGLSILLILVLTYSQLSALVDAIFALAAYRYATVRKSDLFPEDSSYAEHAFVKPKKRRTQSEAATVSTSDAPPVSADKSSS